MRKGFGGILEKITIAVHLGHIRGHRDDTHISGNVSKAGLYSVHACPITSIRSTAIIQLYPEDGTILWRLAVWLQKVSEGDSVRNAFILSPSSAGMNDRLWPSLRFSSHVPRSSLLPDFIPSTLILSPAVLPKLFGVRHAVSLLCGSYALWMCRSVDICVSYALLSVSFVMRLITLKGIGVIVLSPLCVFGSCTLLALAVVAVLARLVAGKIRNWLHCSVVSAFGVTAYLKGRVRFFLWDCHAGLTSCVGISRMVTHLTVPFYIGGC